MSTHSITTAAMAVLFTIVGIICTIVSNKSRQFSEKHATEANYTLRINKGFAWFFMFLSIVCLGVIILINVIDKSELGEDLYIFFSIVLSLLLLLSIYLILHVTVSKLIVKGEELEFVGLFKKRIKCTFSEITKIVMVETRVKYIYYIYVENKKVYCFDTTIKYGFNLLNKMQERNIPLYYKGAIIDYSQAR